MKATLRKIDDIVSWILLFAVFILLIYVVFTTVTNAQKGEETFIFGYRPAIVLTGSMEPYMLTNSVVLTKEVTSVEELNVGDVITFHVENEQGNNIRITHRLTGIDNGILFTKGDNNPSGDGIPLTIDNVESKVVAVCNQTAWLVALWQTTKGKITLLCVVGTLLLCYIALKLYFAGNREEREVTPELMDEYRDLALSMGKTPRQLFTEDLTRHKSSAAPVESPVHEKDESISDIYSEEERT